MAKETILTPQQILFLQYYTDPKSETFGNAKTSAIKAKYSEEYADVITSRDLDWLSENVGDMKLLKKAERNLDKALDLDITDDKKGDRALKATIFVAGTLGKNKYSTKTDDAMSKIADKIEAINYIMPDANNNKTN